MAYNLETEKDTINIINQSFADHNAHKAANQQVQAQAQVEQDNFRLQGNLQTLRENVITAKRGKGAATAFSQSAIDVIMNRLNVSFETARQMVFDSPNYQTYKDKLIVAAVNNDPSFFEKGLCRGAREIIER